MWDETHFGKFGSWYINRTFFFDVHPPLGKMLIGAFGYLSGYDGAFPFIKPGDKYENVSYIGMRVSCTAMGAALVPFSFITVWEMTHALPAATFGAALILADGGLLTLSQYILLDPLLLFFIMASVTAAAKFNSQRDKPFSVGWWSWLIVTGVMLSGSVSVKFVGVFVVLYVGCHTIAQLWEIYGDLAVPLALVIKHFLSRALGLIVVPTALYLFYFYIHLAVLNKSGNGDGFYSSAFQSQLEGNPLHNASMPLELAYGAEITLKSQRSGGGYLHSHLHLYPEGGAWAVQQQITTYSHKDINNKWIVKKADTEPLDWDDEDEVTELVRHGDSIRLEHVPTGRNLHSHRLPSPVTTRHYQVSGYGENGVGDANDVWRVEVVGAKPGDVVKTLLSKVRFMHPNAHCALLATTQHLPKWGYEQMEVTCNPNTHEQENLWNVEDNAYPKLPNSSFHMYAPSYWSKLLEAHTVMLQGNAGLKPKEGEITSQPWQWPINLRGQWFSAIDGYKVYLLGNPIIWWGNLVVMATFLCVYVANSFAERRGKVTVDEEARRSVCLRTCCWLLLAWALHYLPFYFMGRILYFHHYFPALLFSSMLTGVLLDYVLESLPQLLPSQLASATYLSLTVLVFSTLGYSFYLFAPLSYGMHEVNVDPSNSTLQHLRWLNTWEF